MVVAGTFCGTPRRERRLAAGRLADAGHQHAAENGFVDLLGVDAAVLDRGLGGGSAELRGGQCAERALE